MKLGKQLTFLNKKGLKWKISKTNCMNNKSRSDNNSNISNFYRESSCKECFSNIQKEDFIAGATQCSQDFLLPYYDVSKIKKETQLEKKNHIHAYIQCLSDETDGRGLVNYINEWQTHPKLGTHCYLGVDQMVFVVEETKNNVGPWTSSSPYFNLFVKISRPATPVSLA